MIVNVFLMCDVIVLCLTPSRRSSEVTFDSLCALFSLNGWSSSEDQSFEQLCTYFTFEYEFSVEIGELIKGPHSLVVSCSLRKTNL